MPPLPNVVSQAPFESHGILAGKNNLPVWLQGQDAGGCAEPAKPMTVAPVPQLVRSLTLQMVVRIRPSSCAERM